MNKEELQDIADEIICYSDGVYDIQYTDKYYSLSFADKNTVRDMIFEQIDNCEECGWFWDVDHLDSLPNSGELLCWQCLQHLEEEE